MELTSLNLESVFTTIQDRQELFRVIFQNLQPIFHFDDAVVVLFDETQRFSTHLLSDQTTVPADDDLYKHLFKEKLPVAGTPYEEFVQFKEPQIIDNNYLFAKYADHWGVQILKKYDLAAHLQIPLFYDGRILGTLEFHSREPGKFQLAQLPAFGRIGEKVAIGVANIVAREEAKRKEQEKMQLLEITRAITHVRDSESLFEVVCLRLKPIFGFKDVIITVLEENRQECRYLLMNRTNVIAPREDFPKDFLHVIKGTHYERVYGNADYCTSVWRIEEDRVAYPDSMGVRLALEAGYRVNLNTPLRFKGQLIGCMEMIYGDDIDVDQHLLQLAEYAGSQVAIAVANILANEKLMAAQKINEQLLEITRHLSTIRNRDDLWKVITESIRPLVDFDDAVVITFEKDGLSYRHLLAMPSDERRQHPCFKEIINKRMPIAGSPMEYLFTFPELGETNTVELTSRYPDYPGIVLMRDTGLNFSLVLRLTIAGNFIGQLHFHFAESGKIKPDRYPIYLGIAGQVAVAVSNILANEQILARERDTNNLLKLSEALSMVRDREQLLDVLRDRAKAILGFDDLPAIFLLDEDLQYYYIYFNKWYGSQRSPMLSNWRSSKTSVQSDAAAQLLINANRVQILQLRESKEKWPDHPAVKIAESAGVLSALSIPLNSQGRLLGIIAFYSYDEDRFFELDVDVIRSTGEIIASALANILGSEALHAKTDEIVLLNERLVNFNRAVTPFQSRKEFLGVVRSQLAKYIEFDGFYIRYFDKEFERQLFLTDELPEEIRREESVAKLDRVAYNGDEWSNIPDSKREIQGNDLYIQYFDFSGYKGTDRKTLLPIFSAAWRCGMTAGMTLTLWTGERVVGCITFMTRAKEGFEKGDEPLLRQICEAIGIGVSNVVLYEEMMRGRGEIEKLNRQLQTQNNYLIEEVESRYSMEEFIGQSDVMKMVYDSIGLVAKTETSVLILGETGTGKEIVARAIHNRSPRKNKPLIKLNCAALPAQLIESELFGHERGAFTGAIDRRIGKFEIADGSTLFLDEIGEMPLELQAKLLRAIQEKEVERLGSNKVLKVDVRIIAATNRNLTAEVLKGTFRSDLFYRLNVFPILLAPLRERKGDLQLLTAHFVQRASKKIGRTIAGLSRKVLAEMEAYDWPGNIRELEHLIERAVLMCDGNIIRDVFLPKAKQKTSVEGATAMQLRTLAEQERDYILHVLKECRYHVYGPDGAAAILGVPPSTLQSRMKKLGIRRKHVMD